MKKVFIISDENRFICHVEEVTQEIPKSFGSKIVASFDVSQVFLNVI